ncbi:hypothetical protein EYZ11_011934 [Aspergillus tanneri]|uniref:Uncharacterized protein n=1 Tax=Aspergillus tanneri TaxID=1220188 RepID=A0A4S3J240_9EURO|nr:hypothetical protein EYZ11_011934 [Aspergillus tanneri]
MVKNIAEELAKTELSCRWVSRFYHQRKLADNSRYFYYFFNLVRCD